MKKYKIELNEKQLEQLIVASEIYMRLGLAQFDYAIEMGFKIPIGKYQGVKQLSDEIKLFTTGMTSNMSYGVGCEEFEERHKIIHDIHDVLRHRLAWDNNPNGGNTVNFYTPMFYSKQEPIKIERIDSTLSEDGYDSKMPTKVGKYEMIHKDIHNRITNIIIIKKIKNELWAFNESADIKLKLKNIVKDKFLWKKIDD